EGEVVEAATRMQLEVVLLDAIAFALRVGARQRLDARDGGRLVERVGQERAVHVGRRVVEPREAAALEVDGEHPLKGRSARVQVADRRALERGGPRVGRAQRGW